MRTLTTTQLILILAVLVTVSVLTFFGKIPASVLVGILGVLVPSPLQPIREESSK